MATKCGGLIKVLQLEKINLNFCVIAAKPTIGTFIVILGCSFNSGFRNISIPVRVFFHLGSVSVIFIFPTFYSSSCLDQKIKKIWNLKYATWFRVKKHFHHKKNLAKQLDREDVYLNGKLYILLLFLRLI